MRFDTYLRRIPANASNESVHPDNFVKTYVDCTIWKTMKAQNKISNLPSIFSCRGMLKDFFPHIHTVTG